MRGKGVRHICGMAMGRITPAHAGKRSDCLTFSGNFKYHPRTCGEKVLLLFLRTVYLGSPPHMRGKDFIIWSS